MVTNENAVPQQQSHKCCPPLPFGRPATAALSLLPSIGTRPCHTTGSASPLTCPHRRFYCCRIRSRACTAPSPHRLRKSRTSFLDQPAAHGLSEVSLAAAFPGAILVCLQRDQCTRVSTRGEKQEQEETCPSNLEANRGKGFIIGTKMDGHQLYVYARKWPALMRETETSPGRKCVISTPMLGNQREIPDAFQTSFPERMARGKGVGC
ncbi:unnamed protein product [Lepidochelys kempii]